MRAISLHQPWATLLAAGEKRVETRGWPFPAPLPCVLAIHAAKKWTRQLKELALSQPFARSLLRCGFAGDWDDSAPGPLPLGAIVGVVRVVACYPTLDYAAPLSLTAQERAFGDYRPGRFAWLCDQFCGLSFPAPCVGRQSMFRWEPPAGLLLPDWAKEED